MNTSSNKELCGPLQHWLHSLPQKVPIQARTDTPMIEGKRLEYWIAESNLSADSLVTALLWLRIGVIDPPHEIVQDGTTPLASYLHGIVHRLEGDYWNSKYWFRQVRDSRLLQSLSQSMEQKLEGEGLASIATGLRIMQANVFDPSALVTAVEHQNQQSEQGSNGIVTIERISWIEWTSLWGNV